MSIAIIYSFKCTRCACEHTDVELQPLTNPAVFDETRFNFWAMCPTRLEPMFLSLPQVYEDGIKGRPTP